MVFKNFYIQVVIRIALIIFTSLLLSWLIISGQHWIFIIHAILLLCLEGWLLVKYTNRWNTELSSYFDRLQAGDPTISSTMLDDFPKLRGMSLSLKKLKNSIGAERKRHEMENEYFKVVSSNVATGIVVTDAENKVRFINPAALHFFGITMLRHLGHLERHHPGSFSVLGSMKTGESGTLNIFDGSIRKLMMIRLSELIKDGERLKVFSMEDIEQAIRKNELESWQKLIRVLNHEIMNSISPINSTVQTLTDIWNRERKDEEKELIAKTLKGLNIIKERGEGLKTFVGAYRNLTSTLSPNLAKVEMKELIEKVTMFYIKELESRGITLEIKGSKGSCELNTDPDLLSQALINILKNAMEAFVESANNPTINIDWKTEGNKMILTISDNGMGMPEETLKNASVPFYTTKDGGTGVGLSLTRQIISALDGDIHIISKEGEGTKIDFILNL